MTVCDLSLQLAGNVSERLCPRSWAGYSSLTWDNMTNHGIAEACPSCCVAHSDVNMMRNQKALHICHAQVCLCLGNPRRNLRSGRSA